jgi:hypothetical protein
VIDGSTTPPTGSQMGQTFYLTLLYDAIAGTLTQMTEPGGTTPISNSNPGLGVGVLNTNILFAIDPVDLISLDGIKISNLLVLWNSGIFFQPGSASIFNWVTDNRIAFTEINQFNVLDATTGAILFQGTVSNIAHNNGYFAFNSGGGGSLILTDGTILVTDLQASQPTLYVYK